MMSFGGHKTTSYRRENNIMEEKLACWKRESSLLESLSLYHAVLKIGAFD